MFKNRRKIRDLERRVKELERGEKRTVLLRNGPRSSSLGYFPPYFTRVTVGDALSALADSLDVDLYYEPGSSGRIRAVKSNDEG